MRYADLDIFGIYITPFVFMLCIAALLTAVVLRLGDRLGITRHVWHPRLFESAVYVIVLSLVVIGMGVY